MIYWTKEVNFFLSSVFFFQPRIISSWIIWGTNRMFRNLCFLVLSLLIPSSVYKLCALISITFEFKWNMHSFPLLIFFCSLRVWVILWVGQWMSDVHMSYHSDWNYCTCTINNSQIAACKGKSCLWRFHSAFRMTIFVFHEQKQVFLYWPYSDISNAAFIVIKPSLTL